MRFLRPVRSLAAAALATGLLLTSAAGPARADRTIMPPVAGDVSAWAPNSGWIGSTRLCVQVGEKQAGNFAPVWQDTCRRYGDTQLWKFGYAKTVGGAVYLQNRFSGKCLEVIDYSTNYGAPTGQYTCYEGTNQLWRMHWNYQDGYAQFENVNSGLCLSVDGLSTAALTRIVQNPCYSWAINEQFAPVTPA